MSNSASPFPVAIKFGLISGLLSIVVGSIAWMLDLYTSQTAGYILMTLGTIVTIILVYLATKTHRDENLGGYLTVGQGLGVGFLTVLIGSLISGMFNYLLYAVIDPGLMDKLKIIQEEQMVEQGMSEEQIEQAMEMATMFMTPTAQLLFGLIFGAICGGIIALIISLILRNEPGDQIA